MKAVVVALMICVTIIFIGGSWIYFEYIQPSQQPVYRVISNSDKVYTRWNTVTGETWTCRMNRCIQVDVE